MIGHDGEMPDVKNLRIPVRYLANLLTAGQEAPIVIALERMLAMRGYMRAKTVDGVIDAGIAARVGLTPAIIEDMYKIMAIADYEDRFVIPTAHRELAEEDIMGLRGGCGFTDGNGCSTGISERHAVRRPAQQGAHHSGGDEVMIRDPQGAVGAADLPERRAAAGGPRHRDRAGPRGPARPRRGRGARPAAARTWPGATSSTCRSGSCFSSTARARCR